MASSSAVPFSGEVSPTEEFSEIVPLQDLFPFEPAITSTPSEHESNIEVADQPKRVRRVRYQWKTCIDGSRYGQVAALIFEAIPSTGFLLCGHDLARAVLSVLPRVMCDDFASFPEEQRKKLKQVIWSRISRSRKAWKSGTLRLLRRELGQGLLSQSDSGDVSAELDKYVLLDLLADASLSDEVRCAAAAHLEPRIRATLATGDVAKEDESHASLLVTFHGDWGQIPRSSIPLVVAGMDVDQVAACLRPTAAVKRLVESMRGFVDRLKSSQVVQEYALALEVCTKTWRDSAEIRLHLHAWLFKAKGGIRVSRCFFMGCAASHCRELSATTLGCAASRRGKMTQYAGAYYTTVAKIGQVCILTSVEPHVHYQVKDTWVTTLYCLGKIIGPVAVDQYLMCVVNAERNVRQVEFVERRRLAGLLDRRRMADLQIVQQDAHPFWSIPPVEAWGALFLHKKDRYPFLVLDGPSCMGKTRFAKSLVPAGRLFYCDCSNGNPPDLRDFSVLLHDSILFDEMSGAAAIQYKKLLQASVDPCKLGCSPTQQHTYSVYVSGVRLVIATNTWRADLLKLSQEDHEWLSRNSVYVSVTVPLWRPAVALGQMNG